MQPLRIQKNVFNTADGKVCGVKDVSNESNLVSNHRRKAMRVAPEKELRKSFKK
jgi:hypothetical protein